MTKPKSIAVALQEADWLMMIVLIRAISIAPSSIVASSRFRHLRQLASRGL
jgi:hypothetical protein